MSPATNFDKIEDLIASTEDPVQRSILVVLSSITRELETNTKATEAIATAFKAHREDFVTHDKIETQERHYIRGAWWAGIVFITFLQSAGAWLIFRAVHSNDQQDALLALLDKRMVVLETIVKSHNEMALKALEKLP